MRGQEVQRPLAHANRHHAVVLGRQRRSCSAAHSTSRRAGSSPGRQAGARPRRHASADRRSSGSHRRRSDAATAPPCRTAPGTPRSPAHRPVHWSGRRDRDRGPRARRCWWRARTGARTRAFAAARLRHREVLLLEPHERLGSRSTSSKSSTSGRTRWRIKARRPRLPILATFEIGEQLARARSHERGGERRHPYRRLRGSRASRAARSEPRSACSRRHRLCSATRPGSHATVRDVRPASASAPAPRSRPSSTAAVGRPDRSRHGAPPGNPCASIGGSSHHVPGA